MIDIKINGLNKLLKQIDKYPEISEKHINKAINRSLMRVQDQAKREAPYGTTGQLRGNWKLKTGRFEGSLTSQAKSQGYPYGLAVEYGTKPHFPPVSSIAPWAKRKGISPYAVARSIAKKGTKANPFLQRSADKQEKNVEKEFSQALEAIIKEI